MFDVIKIRRDFPILATRINGKPLVYLDNAATTHKPRVVMDQIARFYKLQNSNVHRGSHTLSNHATREFESARVSVAEFIGADDPTQVIWTKGATEAANLLAYSLGELLINTGDVILVSTMEHHANIVPWQQTAIRKGAVIIAIPLTPQHELDMQAYQRLLTEHKPKIVALTHASNALGVINPITACCSLAKEVNAVTVIDGSQAIAHIPINVKQIGCDFYFFSGHKCYAPGGVGVLWGNKPLLEAMPVWQCGGEMITHVSFEQTTFNTLPFKFEAGTPPVADALGLAAAMQYLSQLDRLAIMSHETEMRRTVVDRLSLYPEITLYAPHADNVGIVSLSIQGVHHQDAALLLDEEGLAVRTGHHCAMPLMQSLSISGTLRASFALYNTLDEAHQFVEHIISLIPTIATPKLTQALKPDTPSPAEDNDLSCINFPRISQLEAFDQALFAASDQHKKLAMLLSCGDDFEPLPAVYHTQIFQVKGCESDIWLVDKHQKVNGLAYFSFAVDSNARIMHGLALWALTFLQGKSASEIQNFDLSETLASRALHRFISPSRTNGLHSIVDAIKQSTFKHQ